MPLVYSLYIGILISAIFVNLILIVMVLKYRFNNMAKLAIGLFILTIVNQLTILFSFYSPSAEWAFWWLVPFRLSIQAFLIPCGLIFMQALIRSGDLPFKRWIAIFLPFSIVLALGNLTNDWHGGLYELVTMSKQYGIYIRTAWRGGPWLWVNLAYMQGLGAVLIFSTMRWVLRMKAEVRWRWLVFLVPQSLTYILALLDPFQLTPAPGLLWTPVAVGLFSSLLAIGVWYFDLLSIPLVARELLIRYLPDVVLVLDSQNCLIDLNPVGEKTLKISINTCRGKKLKRFCKREISTFCCRC